MAIMERKNVRLSYSVKALNEKAKKAVERQERYITIATYDGTEFTARNPRPNEPLRYNDEKIVYQGDIDESKMRYTDKLAKGILEETNKLLGKK